MLCVIRHISDGAIENPDGNNMNDINNIIKVLFCGLSDDKWHVTLYILWSDYTDFNNKNGTFDGDKFIYISKDIHDVNSRLW